MTEQVSSISLINSRSLLLKPIHRSGEIYTNTQPEYLYLSYSNKELESVTYPDGFSVSVGSTISIQTGKYKIQYIKKDEQVRPSYLLHTHLLTRSFYFIMPVLGGNMTAWRYNTELCNCFLAKEGEDTYGEYIFVLMRFSGKADYIDFEKKITQHYLYDSKEDVDPYHVLYKFNISDKYREDVDLILDGKYSYISPEYKERIMDFHLNNNGALQDILSRAESRRLKLERDLGVTIPKELDLISKLDFIKETYISDYKIKSTHSEFEL